MSMSHYKEYCEKGLQISLALKRELTVRGFAVGPQERKRLDMDCSVFDSYIVFALLELLHYFQ